MFGSLSLEQTFNREGKTTLLTGITEAASAREKYLLAAPLMTKVSESVNSMAHNVSDAPTDDYVELYSLQSLLVLIYWRRANSSERNLPCPTYFRYKLLNGKQMPLMMRKPAKPKKMLSRYHANAKHLVVHVDAHARNKKNMVHMHSSISVSG